MDMLSGAQITAAGLTDWRKLGQALHARFVIRDLRRRGPAPGPRVDAGALYFVWVSTNGPPMSQRRSWGSRSSSPPSGTVRRTAVAGS